MTLRDFGVLCAFIGAALVCSWFALSEHDARIRADVQWQQKYNALDSSWRVDAAAHVAAQAKTDTVTRTVTQLIATQKRDTAWRRDTVYVAGDSTPRYAVPIPTVLRQDSTNAACSLLAVTCKAERLAALKERDDLLRENAQLKVKPQRSCSTTSLITLGLGAGVGFYLRGKL